MNGRVAFLQVVGLCADEYELVKDWDCGRMLEQILRQWPLLITDLQRQSILADPSVDAEVRSLAAQEGSSQGELFASKADWHVTDGLLHITVSATVAGDIRKLLVSRVRHSKPFAVHGRERGVMIEPATDSSWKTDVTVAIVSLSAGAVAQMLQTLQPERGIYRWPALPEVSLQVVPSEIKDQDGNVIKVIG